MDDICFPTWVHRSSAFAMARVLSRHLSPELCEAPKPLPPFGVRGLKEGGTAAKRPVAPHTFSSFNCVDPSGPFNPDERTAAAMANDTGAERWVPHASQMGPPALSDVLNHPHVRLLMKLSQVSELTAQRVGVSVKNAPPLLAIMALAVEWSTLPSDYTKGFYTECASFYTTFMQRLDTITFLPGVDVEGFVASLVACGLKLRSCKEEVDDDVGKDDESSGKCTGKHVHLAAFDGRIIDKVIISCIPQDMDKCVGNPIALGALEGLSLTVAKEPILSSQLAQHLQNLIDAFTISPKRKKSQYKQLLCYLLEAICCARDIDYSRLHNWFQAVLQSEYILNGLLQKVPLHARVAASTLAVLTRWMQDTVGAHMLDAKQNCNVSAETIPTALKEGEELIEGVWEALLHARDTWEELCKSNITLYGENVRVVVSTLLRAEMERVKCYRILGNLRSAPSVISTPTDGHDQQQQRQQQQEAKQKQWVDTTDQWNYVISFAEEDSRLRVLGNTLKFLLLRTSVFNVIPEISRVTLRHDIAEQCAKVLTLIASGEADTVAPTHHGSPSRITKTDTIPARFSNNYYNGLESIARELIVYVLESREGEQSAKKDPSMIYSGSVPVPLANETVSRTAVLCLQSLCAMEPHVRSFSVTMVLDAMTRLPMESSTHRDLSSRKLTLGYEMLSCLLVSRQRSILKPLPHGEVSRFGQMLCDTFEDALRLRVMEGDLSNDTSAQFPCRTMIMVSKIFSDLVQRWHTRIRLMIREGLRASTGTETEQLCYIEVLNEECAVLRFLLQAALRCMTNVAWPGSGILYLSPEGRKTSSNESARSNYNMSKAAVSVLSLFLSPLCLIFQLFTLFPVTDLRRLIHHYEDVQDPTKLDDNDHYAHHYYFKPITMNSPFYAENGMAVFRTFWLMLSYYGLTNEALLMTEMNDTPGAFKRHIKDLLTNQEAKCIRLLAASAPPLMHMRSLDYQQAMADIAVFERFLADGVTSRRKELIDALRQVSPVVNELSFSEFFLVNALLTLETLRASCGSISTLTQYQHFEVREFDACDNIRTILQHMTKIVTSRYISALQEMFPDVAAVHINEDARLLILQYGFAIASVRESAHVILCKILHAFPAFVTSSTALPLLWTVIDVLEGSAADVERFCECVQFPHTPAVATDPNSIERRKQLQHAVEFARYWATEAGSGSSLLLLERATQFIVESEMTYGAIGAGLGSQLAMCAQRNSETLAMSSSGFTHAQHTLQRFSAQSIIKRSKAQGQVMATVRLASQGASVDQLFLKQLQSMVRGGLESVEIATQYRKRFFASLANTVRAVPIMTDTADTVEEHCRSVTQEDCSISAGKVELQRMCASDSLLCTVAAFLCSSCVPTSTHLEILRFLVQGPIYLFSSHYIAAAIQGWKWLLSERSEHYAVPLLVHVVEGFQWTIAQHIGLFDGSRPSQSDEVETGNCTAYKQSATSYPVDYNISSPHKLLIDFLFLCYVDERRPVSFHPTVLQLLYRLAVCIVESPSELSTKDLSFSETISYALMVIHICRNLHRANKRRLRRGYTVLVSFASIGKLRQALYQCLLHWFRKSPPSWYFTQDSAAAEEALAALQDLITVFDSEKEDLTVSPSGFLDFELTTPSRRNLTLLASNVRRQIQHRMRKLPANIEEAERQAITSEQGRLKNLIGLLRLLIDHERMRLLVWLRPQCLPRPSSITGHTLSEAGWRIHCEAAAQNDPAILLALVCRFPNLHVLKIATQLVTETPEAYCHIPEAVDLYLNDGVLSAGYPDLHLFTNCGIIQALRFLDERYTMHYPQISTYALRSLLSQRSENLIFYLPQLLQVVAADNTGKMAEFLKKMCDKSEMFTHQLLWALQTEEEGDGELAKKCSQIALDVQRGFNKAQRTFYKGEFAYIEKILSLSGEMKQVEKAKRKEKLRIRLRDEQFHLPITRNHLYLPTHPNWRIVGLISHTAGAMQSAAKCPILVQFHCVPRGVDDNNIELTETEMKLKESHNTVVKACIFKMGDDCRQDRIASQLIGLFQRILDAIHVPFYLYPYGVVTSRKDCGIIECVPHAMSRDQIGKLVESNIAEYFVQTYGHPESVTFHRARDCFIRSMAAYSVASFVLNIKDRHNGNLMIDSFGHLVHIDFGFLFDWSPGGDINFESSPFKLTAEMLQLMGHPVGTGTGTVQSSSLAKALVDPGAYNLFVDLTIRCYLAVRQYARQICILVELMIRSGLHCFKPHKTIQDLAQRLSMRMTELEAADFMLKRINQSKKNLRTVLYDRYQNFFEGIEM